MPLLVDRGLTGAWLAVILATLCSVLLPAAALADGDPASDVLLGSNYFIEGDAGASPAAQQHLGATVEAAAKAGYPVRVAVIATATDLGTITALWRQPEEYASFLGQELGFVTTGPVLVVMPNGLGLYGQHGISAAERALILARDRTGSSGFGEIADVAAAAVESLAKADGHPLPGGAATPSASSSASGGASAVIGWLVFVLGLALIAIAWTASLRARPWRGELRTGGE